MYSLIFEGGGPGDRENSIFFWVNPSLNVTHSFQAFDYELKETPDSHWMYVLMEKGDMDLHKVRRI